jgi:hypothetical protein
MLDTSLATIWRASPGKAAMTTPGTGPATSVCEASWFGLRAQVRGHFIHGCTMSPRVIARAPFFLATVGSVGHASGADTVFVTDLDGLAGIYVELDLSVCRALEERDPPAARRLEDACMPLRVHGFFAPGIVGTST